MIKIRSNKSRIPIQHIDKNFSVSNCHLIKKGVLRDTSIILMNAKHEKSMKRNSVEF